MSERENGVGGGAGNTSTNGGTSAQQSSNAGPSPSGGGWSGDIMALGNGGTAFADPPASGGLSAGSTASSSTSPGGALTTGPTTDGAPATGAGAMNGGTTSTPSRGGGESGGSAASGGIATGVTAKGGTSATGGGAGIGTSATGGVAGIGTSATGGVAGIGTSATGGAATGGTPATGLPYVPADARSCTGLGNICQGESCCTSIQMPGGTYAMGRSEEPNGADYYPSGNPVELPEHTATVAAFALDKYEVTVGRFREFVANYDEWHVFEGNPRVGAGSHRIATNTGWGQSWATASTDLPADMRTLTVDLTCRKEYQTWKATADTNEALPINCVSWYVAFAFCIWDGGRLPTEAEWEYAAAGGSQNQLYPWGNQNPNYNRANYGNLPNGSAFTAVGSRQATGGAGYFGHADLAGSVWEWALDWYWVYAKTDCNNCAYTSDTSIRVIRGGSWENSSADDLRAAYRFNSSPASRYYFGFRCARTH